MNETANKETKSNWLWFKG